MLLEVFYELRANFNCQFFRLALTVAPEWPPPLLAYLQLVRRYRLLNPHQECVLHQKIHLFSAAMVSQITQNEHK